MEVVLDTVSLSHCLRSVRVVRRRDRSLIKVVTVLDNPMERGRLSLVVDKEGSLVDEWKRTCSGEVVMACLSHWEPLGYVHPIVPSPRFSPSVRKQLRVLGFLGTVDKLILRLAVVSRDRIVVSDDSDFWNPLDVDSPGQRNAPIARLCREELRVTILLLVTMMNRVRK